jgi:hypothetical protein
MPKQEEGTYTAPGEEKLLGIEPYWYSVAVFLSLLVVCLIMTQLVY